MRALRFLIAALSIVAAVATASAARVPDFILATDRGPLKLEDLRGKVVYLDYWASWCGPCRETFPFMNELQARYRDKDFVVIAVSVDSDPAAAHRFLAQHPADFIVAYDPDGTTASALRVRGMPTTFLIDRRGEIVTTHIGFRESDKDKIEREIKSLLPAAGEGVTTARTFRLKTARKFETIPTQAPVHSRRELELAAPGAPVELEAPLPAVTDRRIEPRAAALEAGFNSAAVKPIVHISVRKNR